MKYIVRKAYWDYEKEEKWLNEMSAKGMALTDYSWCRYVFTETPVSEYTYRIELLENRPTHPESMHYIRFLEENGVECVATYQRWIYLRKKTSEGAFDIYSDIDSKINLYKRVSVFWNTFIAIEFVAGLTNLATGIMSISTGNFAPWNLIMGCALTLFGLFFLKLSLNMRKKIKKLKQEKLIRE